MRETRCFSILSHYQKNSSDGCYLSVLDSAHSTVGDTCLFISESLYDGVSERCLSLKVAISLFALCFSVSLFKNNNFVLLTCECQHFNSSQIQWDQCMSFY